MRNTKSLALRLFCILLSVTLVMSLTGCLNLSSILERTSPEEQDTQENTVTETDEGEDQGEEEVIVAGTIDTSSDYSFEVQGAFVGMDEYSEEAVVILVCDFTNNSDETISYSSAVDAVAFQGGYELKTAYLQGASTYTYEDIEPGTTIPVFIGWKLISASEKVNISVVDRYHYAKEVLYEESFTIEELIENSKKFMEEFNGIVDEDENVTVST